MLTPDQVSQLRTSAGLSPQAPPMPSPQSSQVIAQRQAALNAPAPTTGEITKNGQPLTVNGSPITGVTGLGTQGTGPASNLATDTNAHAANIVQDLSSKPSFTGALDVAGNVAGEVGSIIGDSLKAVTPQPVKQALSQTAQSVAGTPAAKAVITAWNNFQAQHPDAAKNIGNVVNIAALFGGNAAEPAVDTAVANTATKGADVVGGMVSDVKNAAGNVARENSDTQEAIANIAKQEGGIVAPAKTASQLAQESQAKTWDVIKPRLSANATKAAADSGALVRTGENKVLTQVPTAKDVVNIKLAEPYVSAAGGDPIQTRINIKNGIATEAKNLRTAVGTQGGTFSTANIKGVLNDVSVPSAIKGGAEMNQVKNIKDFVTSIANKVDKNPQGALDLAQQFRQNINSEFGENVWGKATPIGNYIKNVNKALNDFISTRLPNGTLPDGTLIKDSFAKQTQLYNILDNIQIPKLGDQLVTPTAAAPLKIPGSPLSETLKQAGKDHPIIKGAVKAAGRAIGIGAGVHLIP